MKALRFHLIGLPGRVVKHVRQLIIRLDAGAEALATFITARQTIRAVACGPAG
jgi:DNA-binding sugar fermentation-stimulating protein